MDTFNRIERRKKLKRRILIIKFPVPLAKDLGIITDNLSYDEHTVHLVS